MLAHPPLFALGYSEAAMFAREPHGAEISGVISIAGAREFRVDVPPGVRNLSLIFDDVDSPAPEDPLSEYRSWVQQKWAAETGRAQIPPSLDDARAIINFAHELKASTGIILCHCQGGVSRSPAAALLCLAVWLGDGAEERCFDQLLNIRSCAFPHPGLIAYGDSVLGRKGKLLAALRRPRA